MLITLDWQILFDLFYIIKLNLTETSVQCFHLFFLTNIRPFDFEGLQWFSIYLKEICRTCIFCGFTYRIEKVDKHGD